jgi:hypothetical protein
VTDTLGEFVECTRCHNKFHPSVRDHSPEQIEELQKPWQCSGCRCLNPPSEMRCLNCKESRPRKEVTRQAAPARAGQDSGAFRASPRNSSVGSTTTKARDDLPDLAAITAANKCPECGAVNSLVALHCKAYGCRLGANSGK